MNQTFTCPFCAKRYTWKPGFAGKKIFCTCGRQFEAQLPQLPLPEAAKVRQAYSVSHPRQGSSVADRASLYPRHRRAAQVPADQEGHEPFSVTRDRIIPGILLLIGLAGRILQLIFHDNAQHRNSMAALLILFDITLNTSAVILGTYIAAALLEVNFGRVLPVLMKLACVAIAASALAAWVPLVDASTNHLRGWIIAVAGILLLNFISYSSMFELDLQEALSTASIVGLIQTVLILVLNFA